MVNQKFAVWKQFKNISKNDGKKAVQCKFCQKEMAPNATRMLTHLESCSTTPISIRRVLGLVKSLVSEQAESHDDPGTTSTNQPVVTLATTRELHATPAKRLKSSQKHHSFCSSSKQRHSAIGMEKFCDSISQQEQTQADQLLARAVYVTGKSLNMFQDPSWIAAFKHIRPTLTLPSRKAVSGKLLEDEYDRVKTEVESKINDAKFLSLQCDGWSNIRNEPIVNFIFNTPDPVFYETLPTCDNRHTGEYMAEIISKVIDKVTSAKVLSLVTDNAKNMKKAWELLMEKYPHMTIYGCLTHSLQLLIEDLLKIESIENLKKRVSQVIYKIKGSQILQETLKKIQIENNVNVALSLPVRTRWGSFVRSLSSLLANKFNLMALAVKEEMQQFLPKEIKSLLLQDIFWARVESTRSLLKPISDWTTKMEGDKPMPSVVPEIFKDLSKIFIEHVPKSPATKEEEKVMMEALENRKHFCLHSFHFAANILDPRYQGANLTDDEVIDGMEFISKLSAHIDSVNKDKVLEEFARYRAKDGLWAKDFIWKCAEKVTPIVWWNGMCSTTHLSKVAAAILLMPTTSAATERSFSTYGNIHTKKRNRLKADRAGKITYISHNCKLLHPRQQSNKDTSDKRTDPDDDFEVELLTLEPGGPGPSRLPPKTAQRQRALSSSDEDEDDDLAIIGNSSEDNSDEERLSLQ